MEPLKMSESSKNIYYGVPLETKSTNRITTSYESNNKI